MGFDAGSIKARLILDRSEFAAGVDEAKAQAQELGDSVIAPALAIDDTLFVEQGQQVEDAKKQLAEPVEIPATLDTGELDAQAAEVGAVKDEVGTPVDVPVRLDAGEAAAEAVAVRAELDGILGGGTSTGIGGGAGTVPRGLATVERLTAAGITGEDLSGALSNMGYSKQAIGDLIALYGEEMAKAALPTPQEIVAEFYSGLHDTLGSAPYGFAGLPSLEQIMQSYVPNWKWAPPRAVGGGGEQLALPAAGQTWDAILAGRYGLGGAGGSAFGLPTAEELAAGFTPNWLFPSPMALGANGEQLALPAAGMASTDSWLASALSTARNTGDVGFGERWSTMFAGWTSKGLADGVEKAIADMERNGGKLPPGPPGLLQMLGDAGNSISTFFGSKNGVLWSLLNPAVSAPLIPIGGALGLAAGGALAGTAVATGGTLAALLPGMLDMSNILKAYSAISSGQSTKGMAAGAVSAAQAFAPLVSSGKGALGQLEQTIYPQIGQFAGALTSALPSVMPFAKTAVGSMSGFFGKIDSGLQSPGFASFMQQMTRDVGPLMNDFGQVFINLGHAFGGFLRLFAGGPAQAVGAWFVKVTGELSHFANHVQLGHGFVQGMTTVFSDLAPVLHLAWDLIRKFGDALAPIGFQILRIVRPVAEFADKLLHFIPTNLITAIVGVVLGLMAFGKAMAIVTAIADTDPIVLILAAIVALAYGIYQLVKHWHQVWTGIKKIADDAWHFLDKNVLQPIHHFLVHVWDAAVHDAKKAWDTAWGDIKKIAHDAWNFIVHGFGKYLLPLLGPVGVLALGVLEVSKHWKQAWQDIQNWAHDAWTFLDTKVFQKLEGWFSGFGSKVQQAFSGLGGIIEAPFKAAFNTVATIWNDTVGKLSFHIPSWIPGIGGKGFSMPQIPEWRWAGGPVAAGSPYVVGEAGPELIIPNQSGMVVSNDQIRSAMGGGAGPQVVVNVDARGAHDPAAVAAAARRGVGAALPALTAALRGGV